MKKTTLLIGIIALLINFIALSQNNQIEFGLKAGLNYSTLIIDKKYPLESNAKFGFHLGGFISLEMTERFRLKTELLFSTQNTEIEFPNSIIFQGPNDPFFGDNVRFDIKESLILIPIMAEYHLSKNFDLELGPQFGYVVNQDVSGNNDDFSYGNGDYEKFEVALNLGAGFNFADHYRIGLRYNYGIKKRDNTQSSVFQFGLSYKL